jgi:hypothetical protein
MSQQRDFWGGGVLSRIEARKYIEAMLKMLRGETK